jgi:hypothetical protein
MRIGGMPSAAENASRYPASSDALASAAVLINVGLRRKLTSCIVLLLLL